MAKRFTKHALALLGLWVSGGVSAESFDPADAEIIEGVAVVPTILVSEGYDDNMLNDKNGEIDSFVSVVKPQLRVAIGDDISRLYLHYDLESAWYHQSSEDDYLDQELLFGGRHEFTARHRIMASYRFSHDHEERGTGLSEGNGALIDKPVEFDNHKLTATYGFGVREATLNIDTNLTYNKRNYTNFNDLTQYRDRDSFLYGAVGYWNLSGRTSLLVDVSEEAVRYDLKSASGQSQDSDVFRAKTGVRWEVSGKTTGYAKIGWQSKDFDDAAREDFSGLSWDIGAEWSPLSYSVIKIEGGKEAKDPDTTGDYVDETTLTVSWRHGWLERFATTLGATYTGRDYTGIDRNDDLYVARIGGDYSFQRWLRVGLNYEYRQQDSTQANIEYDKNVVYLFVELGL